MSFRSFIFNSHVQQSWTEEMNSSKGSISQSVPGWFDLCGHVSDSAPLTQSLSDGRYSSSTAVSSFISAPLPPHLNTRMCDHRCRHTLQSQHYDHIFTHLPLNQDLSSQSQKKEKAFTPIFFLIHMTVWCRSKMIPPPHQGILPARHLLRWRWHISSMFQPPTSRGQSLATLKKLNRILPHQSRATSSSLGSVPLSQKAPNCALLFFHQTLELPALLTVQHICNTGIILHHNESRFLGFQSFGNAH